MNNISTTIATRCHTDLKARYVKSLQAYTITTRKSEFKGPSSLNYKPLPLHDFPLKYATL